MKKFKSIKLHQDVIDAARARGFGVSTQLYDSGNSDYVRIDFAFNNGQDEVKGSLLWSSFNGIFFGSLEDGTRFDNGSKHLDDVEWYGQLLDLFYETEIVDEVVT